MPTPATTGQRRDKISDMNIGDYISVTLEIPTSGNSSGLILSETGSLTSSVAEIPVSGIASGKGRFYWIKVAKGLLIADRVVMHSVSWDNLNANKWIQGNPASFNCEGRELVTIQGIIRSLTGGVSYADQYGNKSLTDQGYGAFPVNNEWDKYIVNFPQELIQSGKTLDDVFHYTIPTWTQDTPCISIGSSDRRIVRGNAAGGVKMLSDYSSSQQNSSVGFRPCFEYIES